ncbi:prepilin peptidase [Phenylobacterium sp.]|uniref:A24 family peptidase n=1 Tax=Phenylobacterium sp. TaxID=1871053 RepID=UPI0035B03B5B
MSFPEAAQVVTAALLTGVLGWAALSDVRTRRIPNLAVILVLALFPLWAIAGGAVSLPGALGAGALAFAVGFGLYAFGVVGAGDAKLFAAVALFAGITHLGAFALATVLVGGVMAVVSLIMRPRWTLMALLSGARLSSEQGIPYGVAISLGGAGAVWALSLNLPPFVG